MHLEIPEPCHENWQDMTPQEKGRFCDKCCKVVVDFTNMATDKVIQFISERSSDRICGRFRPDQIVVPVAPTKNSVPHRFKVFLAALVLVFGGMLFTGCGTHPEKMGKVASNNFAEQNFNLDTPSSRNNVSPKDTTHHKENSIEMRPKGEVKCVRPDTLIIPMMLGGPMAVPDEPEHALMGKPSIDVNDTIK